MELGHHLHHLSAIIYSSYSPPLLRNSNSSHCRCNTHFFHLQATSRNNTALTSRTRRAAKTSRKKIPLPSLEENEEEDEDEDFDPAADAEASPTSLLDVEDEADHESSSYSNVLSLSEKPDRNLALLDDYDMEEVNALLDPNHRSGPFLPFSFLFSPISSVCCSWSIIEHFCVCFASLHLMVVNTYKLASM